MIVTPVTENSQELRWPVSFAIEAQGRLFSLKLSPQLHRQQKTSCAFDSDKFLKAQLLARHTLLQRAALDTSPYSAVLKRIAINPPKRLVDFIAGEVIRQQSPKVGKRGVIVQFSHKSRLRLLKHAARLKEGASGLFLTFTYRKNMLDNLEAKHHLDLLLRYLKRHYPRGAYIWRMENQERGAIHFHIIALNVGFIPALELTTYWQAVTGDDSYPDIEPLRNRRKVTYYIAKYIAKVEKRDAQASSYGLDSLPYSEIGIGRQWGIVNRKCLPLARLLRAVVSGEGIEQALYDLRRYARHAWPRMSRRIQGFSLFTNDAERWWRLAHVTCMANT